MQQPLTLPTTASTAATSATCCAVSGARSQLGFIVDEHAQRSPPLASIGSIFKAIFPGQPQEEAQPQADVQGARGGGKFKVHKIVGDGRCMFRATVRFSTCHIFVACGHVLETVVR